MHRWYLIVLLGVGNLTCYTVAAKHDDEQNTEKVQQTNRPIVGMLASEIEHEYNEVWPNVYESYIGASYVKLVEGGGARVVPIWIGKPRIYYEELMSKLNGIFLPGSGLNITRENHVENPTIQAARFIIEIAKHLNENGIYFPIYGECFGLELFLYAENENPDYLTECSCMRISWPLNFTKAHKNSRLYGSAPKSVIEILGNEAVAPHFHTYCVTEQSLTDFGLDKQWTTLSTNFDKNGLEFISSLEHKKYPFYGVHFHPEKVLYEWGLNRNISHTPNAIMSAQYFATFFINECRKNGNQFSGPDEENRMLIYNFPAKYTGYLDTPFQQSYLFKSDVDYAVVNEAEVEKNVIFLDV